MKLYSSTFISIVLAFLMFVSYQGQNIDVIDNPDIPQFTYISKGELVIGDELEERVRIEVFDSMNCPDCTDFVLNTLPKIKDLERETDEIDLHLYFIPDINNELYYMSAMSLKCAADQDQFWGMHEKLHRHEEGLDKNSFKQFGKELEINTDALKDCMNENIYQIGIEEDAKYASEKNVTIKPTILINEFKLIGNQPFENIQKIINDIIQEKEADIVEVNEILEQPTDLQQELGAFDLPQINI